MQAKIDDRPRRGADPLVRTGREPYLEVHYPYAPSSTIPGPNVNNPAAETPQVPPQRTSELLEQVAMTWPQDRVLLGDLARLFGGRGYGLLMLVLALPGAVPGISSIAAVPLGLVAVQLAIGLPRPWLPRFLADRSLSRDEFARMVGRVRPHLARIERVLRPRWAVVTGSVGERLLGAVCLALAMLLTIPVLFNLPLVVPIALVSIGMLERDGVIAALGLIVGIAVLGVAVGISWVSLEQGLQWASKWLGM